MGLQTGPLLMPGGIAGSQDVFLAGDLLMCPDTSQALLIKYKGWVKTLCAYTHVAFIVYKRTCLIQLSLPKVAPQRDRQMLWSESYALGTWQQENGCLCLALQPLLQATRRERGLCLNKTLALRSSSTGNLSDMTWQFALSYRKKPWWLLSSPSPVGTRLLFSLTAKRKNSLCTVKWKGN